MSKDILLVGAGPMARDYARVLKAQKKAFFVVGRGKPSADECSKELRAKVYSGGLERWCKENKESIPKHAIVAVSEEELGSATRTLLNHGVKSILVEKPGGLDAADIKKVYALAQRKKANVFVGYNRRFYASVQKALEIIKKDGGLTSFFFEFTEWSHIIAGLKKANGVKPAWFLQNSTHIIDMAFFIGGFPKKMSTYKKGSLSWHPDGSNYAGSGITRSGALFSYIANWQAPGRWSLEFCTRKHRLIFRPVEQLHIQKIGSVAIEQVKIDDKLDLKFKPGIYKEVEAFLGNKKHLLTIEDQVNHISFFSRINKPKKD